MKHQWMIKIWLMALMMNCVYTSMAQPKYEREYSLKPNAVPKQASDFIEAVFTNAKVDWYGEENGKGTSIEAKLRSAGKTYSIEFSDAGAIQDVEILIKFNSLGAPVISAVNRKLNEEFNGFKISKTQMQWTGSAEALKEAILSGPDKRLPASVTTKYELIVKAKKDKTSGYYEVLVNDAGEVQTIRQIVQRNTDNLIY